jgi:hypothetical protein
MAADELDIVDSVRVRSKKPREEGAGGTGRVATERAEEMDVLRPAPVALVLEYGETADFIEPGLWGDSGDWDNGDAPVPALSGEVRPASETSATGARGCGFNIAVGWPKEWPRMRG